MTLCILLNLPIVNFCAGTDPVLHYLGVIDDEEQAQEDYSCLVPLKNLWYRVTLFDLQANGKQQQ